MKISVRKLISMHDQVQGNNVQNQQMYDWTSLDLDELEPARWVVNNAPRMDLLMKRAHVPLSVKVDNDPVVSGNADPLRQLAEIFFHSDRSETIDCYDQKAASLEADVTTENKENINLTQFIDSIVSKCTPYTQKQAFGLSSTSKHGEGVHSTLSSVVPQGREQVWSGAPLKALCSGLTCHTPAGTHGILIKTALHQRQPLLLLDRRVQRAGPCHRLQGRSLIYTVIVRAAVLGWPVPPRATAHHGPAGATPISRSAF